VSTSTPFAVSFPNIPDAGSRPFGTFDEAAAFVARAGFHAEIRDARGVVVARNGSMGGAVAARSLELTYGDVQNGDRVWIQGYLFEVRNLRRYPKASNPTYTDDVIRFDGIVVDRSVDIAGSGYDGGVYGGYAFVAVHVERAIEAGR
jgi:hypothetical protein